MTLALACLLAAETAMPGYVAARDVRRRRVQRRSIDAILAECRRTEQLPGDWLDRPERASQALREGRVDRPVGMAGPPINWHADAATAFLVLP